MAVADFSSTTTSGRGFRPGLSAMLLGLAVFLAVLKPFLPAFAVRLPDAAVLPYDVWFQSLFDFLKDDLGLIYVTRTISAGLEWLLDITANLFYGKHRWPYIGPMPWAAVAAVVAIIGYALKGWKMALLGAVTFVWVALVGQWEIAMQTMSVIAVAAPVAVFVGLVLGIFAWKFPRFEAFLAPVLAIFQTLPFFTYLLPAVIFFKVGPTAGCVATILYAMPPMVLMSTLGLKKVRSEVVEAGHMSGSTRWQMLRHVYIPSARTEILVGVNQVIMLSLAMVVLTAFIGMPGLGAKLLSLMNSLKLGRSFEIGVTIVLIAVTMDRMSKAWVVTQPVHYERGTPWWIRHRYPLLAVGAFIGITVLAQAFPILAEIKRGQDLSIGSEIDSVITAILSNDVVTGVTGWLRGFLVTSVLIPFRNALLWLPTISILLACAAAGCAVGGWRSAALASGFLAIVAATGWWDRAVITLYSVISAVCVAALVGLPLGVLAALKRRWSDPILIACDTAQTFPSFVYLIPAIMLFGVSDVSVVFAIFIFATVPLMRYTIEGIRAVPEEVAEAADMSGATRMQKLFKVQLPLALPTMVIGVNQAIMFAFFMVIIAAFIGTQDLGQELQKTLAGNELGKNFVLGMCVALMALAFNHILMRWSEDRRKTLGLG
ncbi:ABC transporter permease subunit [Defluviimonas sp. WL0050]|uniref:ABC transporter permease subunit n=1 Tax=Albidovulum litorale TaxID=2984134 RepID=A0ABT2ZLG8_9RHOB|nr:ABC transporter permease subunit [Defluviimonas sp. WL0050]MCV2871973.1 ABC transporter permease subunit [Defluviimonas sp. WL0050]